MDDSELDRFRRKWQEEVQAKTKRPQTQHARNKPQAQPVELSVNAGTSKSAPRDQRRQKAHGKNASISTKERTNTEDSKAEGAEKHVHVGKTALELYEAAVESEANGTLGESVDLYRKAFRIDADIDKVYARKHFPPRPAALLQSQGTGADADTLAPATPAAEVLSISDLIESFAGVSIAATPPFVPSDPLPPCPIASLPSELLVQILSYFAESDLVAFAQSAQVCKRFAYLVSAEESLWRNIVRGEKYGLGGMKTKFERDILGKDLPMDHVLNEDTPSAEDSTAPDISLLAQNLYNGSYRAMHRNHPRIRFTGLYISTVNYARPGASSPAQVTWNTPVHIVTYYRYLRFFRDGTVLSLLSTVGPSEVVPMFNKEQPRGKGLPQTSFMHFALSGRWRCAPVSVVDTYTHNQELYGGLPPEDAAPVTPTTVLDEVEIETEASVGGTEKYIYKMRLCIRNSGSGKGAKGTRLQWRWFGSYGVVSDDWSVFGLRNDRSFRWVKVGALRDV